MTILNSKTTEDLIEQFDGMMDADPTTTVACELTKEELDHIRKIDTEFYQILISLKSSTEAFFRKMETK